MLCILGRDMKNTGMNRRAFISTGCAAMAGAAFATEEQKFVAPLGVPLKQEPLPFDFGALEPHLDAATLRLHHERHHADVLTKLNKALEQINMSVGNVVALMPNIRSMVMPFDARRRVVRMGGPPERLPVETQKILRDYGGAHINHTAFWRFLTPPGTGPAGPQGRVAETIARDFGSIEDFKRAFSEAAMKHFGSGWAFLVCRRDGSLFVTTLKKEDNPLMVEFVKPEQQGRFILCLDLWEHAYYLKYRNDRQKYVEAWWNVVNWNFVSRAYEIATSPTSI